MISEIRSRGPNQSSDEIVELFNATSAPVVLDSTWQVMERSSSSSSYSVRWTGTGKTIAAFGHYLLGGQTYSQTPAADGALSAISDASSVTLVHGGTTVDAVCYYYATNPFDSGFTCEGTPLVNPHNMTTSTDADASLERKPGGAAGNCTDTGNNSADFIVQMPATPQSTASAPTP